MNESDRFRELLDKQCQNLHQLTVATALIKCKGTIKSDLLDVRTEVCKLKRKISEMRGVVDKLIEENAKCCEIMALLELLDNKIVHMGENVPQKLIRDYQDCNAQLVQLQDTKTPQINTCNKFVHTDTKKESTYIEDAIDNHKVEFKDCKKVLFNEPEICACIPLLTEEEFSKLPKYIIGRQPLSTVNSLINTINQILKSKYSLLALGKAEVRKRGELDLYLHYKKQQTTVCEGAEHVYFFNAEDYQRATKLKLDKTKLNLITALRHCKRLREFRQGKDLQYVVIP